MAILNFQRGEIVNQQKVNESNFDMSYLEDNKNRTIHNDKRHIISTDDFK